LATNIINHSHKGRFLKVSLAYIIFLSPYSLPSAGAAAVMAELKIKSDSKYDDYDYPTSTLEAKSGHPGHTTPEQDAQVFQLLTQLEQAGYTERLDTLSLVESSPISPCPWTLISSRSSGSYEPGNSMLKKRKKCIELPTKSEDTG
jgi:hypothetical protein